MPLVVPGLCGWGATVCTNVPVEFCSDWLKFVHSAIGLLPTSHRLPVNFAGASGRIGGLYCGLPSTCSCQLPWASDALRGCRAGTIALA